MSMDLSGVVIEDPLSTNPSETTTTIASATSVASFEDKLRQEVILIPEDIQDIHIQASAEAEIVNVTGSSSIANSVVEDNNSRYGKGKHWKKNMKKNL